MALLPLEFPSFGQQLASYSYTDLASGAGYQTYYAGNITNSGAYILSPNVFYSQRVFTNKTATSTADTAQNDLDFDILFQLPRKIKGDVMVNVPILLRNRETGGSFPYSTYVKVYVRKWDGTTETEIANNTSETWSGTLSPVGHQTFIFAVKINVPTETHFKKQEYLRITIEHHGWNTSGGSPSTNYVVGHDPEERIIDPFLADVVSADALDFDTGDPTALKVQVPFVIDT